MNRGEIEGSARIRVEMHAKEILQEPVDRILEFQAASLVFLVRRRTMAKVLSIGRVVRKCFQCSAGNTDEPR